MMTKPASDLRLALERSNGPLPPPHACRWRLDMGPEGGRLSLQPSYLGPEAPHREAGFPLSSTQLQGLADCLQSGLLDRDWPPSLDSPVGGGTCSLEGCLGGRAFYVPADLNAQDAAAAKPLFQAVEDLVPPGLLDGLLKQWERWARTQA